ncbi:RsmB/NOP family class I SAM-dependent RNA methyltransferase [Enhydrobacter aerosaccus]|uniref:RsmB/NOP family class I SAM-dependent RNA methyltransferase n=1 Tax=Enhydrobacter aerosaccus TaxID=225324 RepID=UPI001E61FF8B|nr:RsmB/NOP family class I SAM-dependent RNA methyltransferase [Enhydrobacter aerosaccus]
MAATIELLDEIVSRSDRPADLVANAFFRARRFIGGGDRRAISERVWGILRRYGQLAWWLDRTRHPDRSGRAIVGADLMLVEKVPLHDLQAMFDGGRYRPAPLDEAETRALRQLDGHSLSHPQQPDWVRLNVQEWVVPHLREAYGESWGREIAALETPPPVDLRVNRLKATVEEAQRALAREGIETERMLYAPNGLRLKKRLSVVAGDAFQNGLVEIQDEGSQLVAALVDAQPGMQIVDYCAGAGGKTLAIAAGMNNKGRVVAMDVLETRLDRSAQRLRRAGAHNVERRALGPDNAKWLKRQKGMFDRVLVDAPCTGTGTWRRNPDGRWTLSPHDLAELLPKQAGILAAASRLVKPGGGLIYATCSVLPAENERQIDAFLESHPDFAVVPIADLWPDAIGTPLPPDLAHSPYLRLSPLRHGTDGFFAAALVRRSSPPPSKGEVSSSHEGEAVLRDAADGVDPSAPASGDTSPDDGGGKEP